MIFDKAVFPSQCVLCRKPVGEKYKDGLCESCRRMLEQDSLNERVLENTDVISVGKYSGALRSAILRTKEGNNPAAIPAMQYWLCMLYDRACADFQADIITFVPSSTLRNRKRGFSIPQELAKALSEYTHTEMQALFKHTVFSMRQAGMSGTERNIHAKKSIALKKNIDVTGKKIIIIDDIMASGSTMNWCAGLLRACGASEIVGLTIAKS